MLAIHCMSYSRNLKICHSISFYVCFNDCLCFYEIWMMRFPGFSQVIHYIWFIYFVHAVSPTCINNNYLKTKFCTWSPAPISSSSRSIWTPLAMFGDCCSRATKRFSVFQSKPLKCHFLLDGFVQTIWFSEYLFAVFFFFFLNRLTFWGIVVANVFHCVTNYFLIVNYGSRCDFSA